METEIQSHAHSVAAREPAICAPSGEEEHALNSFLAHDRAEEGRPRNALRFLQALVEGGNERAGPAPDFGRDSEDGVERPGGALRQALVSVVTRVEDGDKDVTSGEESA